MKIIRHTSGKHGAFGELIVGGLLLDTVERPWLNNAPSISCVPAGKYRLIWQPTTTSVPKCFDGHTWYLSGGTVTHRYYGGRRTRCAFHIANRYTNVNGCIGVGLHGMDENNEQVAVVSSRLAMETLYEELGPGDTDLSIKWGSV